MDLCPEWFSDSCVVGLTAGTSTPDVMIDEVGRRIGSFPGNQNDSPEQNFVGDLFQINIQHP
jgi:4-hydroxy-3-methylbut-2-enyl diphosphate reductase IspH